MSRVLAIALLCAIVLTGCFERTDKYLFVPESSATVEEPSATVEESSTTVEEPSMETADPSTYMTSPSGNTGGVSVGADVSGDGTGTDSASGDVPAESGEVYVEEDVTGANYSMAPDFTLKDLSGNSVSLKDYRGKIVFLNIWQTWCPPCQEELPLFQRLINENSDVAVLTVVPLAGEKVALSEAEGTVRKYLSDKDFTFPVLVDPSADGGIATSGRYAGNVVPLNYVIGTDGKLYLEIEGAYTWAIIERILTHMRAM